jgi:glycerophosphoryl diester phosphodiesterase
VSIPELVAHRGWASRYPENTLVGIEAAMGAGVPWVEFDVQLSADAVPVVIHDTNLRRTAGIDASVRDLTLDELRSHSVHEPERLGTRFRGVSPPSLADVVSLLGRWPRAGAMVEIKRESAEAYGVDATVALVCDVLAPVRERCVVISFVERAVMSARRLGAPGVGWVLNYYDDDARRLADAMAPDYLFCDRHRLPTDPEPPWPGPWRWGTYEVTEVECALALGARGVSLVESKAAGELAADPRLAGSGGGI